MTVALAPRPKVKLRVEDFDLLAESGGLAGLERTELLDGDIYLMSPQYRPHAFAKTLLLEALMDYVRSLRPRLWAISEASVAMLPNDEPIPDITVTNAPRGKRAIPAESVALIVEISDDSLKYDLGYKAALYARQGVPEYWVIDLEGQQVVRHAEPGAEGYARVERFAFGAAVAAVTLHGLVVKTQTLRD